MATAPNRIRIIVPAPLRRFMAGKSELETGGTTLREVLAEIDSAHAGVSERILEGGDLRSFLRVFVGDEDVKHTGGLDTQVSDGDTVTILTAIAGG